MLVGVNVWVDAGRLFPPSKRAWISCVQWQYADTHTPTCQCACTFSYADLCWWAPQCQVQGRSSSLPCRQPPGHTEFKGFAADLALFHSTHSPHSTHSLSLHDLKVQKIYTHMCIFFFSYILTRRSYCHLSQVFIYAHDGDSQQLLRDLLSYKLLPTHVFLCTCIQIQPHTRLHCFDLNLSCSCLHWTFLANAEVCDNYLRFAAQWPQSSVFVTTSEGRCEDPPIYSISGKKSGITS